MKARSNNPAVETAVQKLLDEMERISRAANREIHVGPGMRSLHGDDENLLLESVGGRGGGGAACKKWVTSVRSIGEYGSQKAIVVKNGTVNQTSPSNVGEEVEYQPKELNFILLKCSTSSNGAITKAEIEVNEENLAGTQEDERGAPPSPFYVLLGSLKMNSVKMEVCHSLSAVPVETRRTSKEQTPDYGQEPFDRWYRWEVRELSTV